MEMNQLQVIVHRQARVLTTGQLAESYGTDVKVISNNYTRNADRYTEGKHFIRLTGEKLKDFKAIHQIDESLKFASILYLWTEKGAWLHAKSLNTDAAWDAYEMLVDEYYKVIEQQQAQDPVELALQTSLKNYQEIKGMKDDISLLKDSMRIDGRQEHALKEQGKAKVFETLGGYGSPAYEKLSRKVFHRMWGDFKRHFLLPRSMDLPKAHFDEAVKYIAMWRPDTSTAIEIESYNKQTKLKLVQ